MTPRILIIAGSDSGGGAGIQADIKTVTMLGGHAMTAVTAITAQNTLGVQRILPVPAEIVLAQIDSVVSDIGVDAVKIGMLGSAETAHAVAEYLSSTSFLRTRDANFQGRGAEGRREMGPRFRGGDDGVPIVFDPVMVATSGDVLADADTIAAFARLMRVATVTTPNLPELVALGGEDAVLASGSALLVKGGHGAGEMLTDRFLTLAGEVACWSDARIATTSTHGTGCTLASAIAVGLARGSALTDAIAQARRFVRIALREAPGLGHGHGPMGHAQVRLDCVLGAPMLNQVTLPLRDFAASVAFYELLGLRRIVDAAPRYARFESAGGVTLSIEAAEEMPGGPVVFVECADLDAVVARVGASGIAVASPRDEPWGWREARVTDPAGNALCLYQAGEMRRFPPWRLA